jgi:hypothetical protein
MLSTNEISAEGVLTTEQNYQARLNRYVTAMHNDQPDRIPIRLANRLNVPLGEFTKTK